MKKATYLSMIAAVGLLGACQSERTEVTTSANQEFLYYIRYTNFAWFATDQGYYVDRDGQFYSFDLEGNPELWEGPVDDRYSVSDLRKNFAHNAQVEFQLASDYVSDFASTAEKLVNAPIHDLDQYANDLGVYALYVLTYDPWTKKYTQHLIKMDSDHGFYERDGKTARQVIQWLEDANRAAWQNDN